MRQLWHDRLRSACKGGWGVKTSAKSITSVVTDLSLTLVTRSLGGSIVVFLIIAFLAVPNGAGAELARRSASLQTTTNVTTTIRPQRDDHTVLFNPGMGLVMACIPYEWGLPDSEVWRRPLVDIAYTRFKWAALEKRKGVYDFSPIRQWMEPWLRAGYRVAFGVYSSSIGDTATPKWVFDSGVPGVQHMNGSQTDPVHWDPRYLAEYSGFVKHLGQAFDGMERLEFVDIRGVGVYGEMHLATFRKGMWTSEELRSNGYTVGAHTDVYKKQIDLYRKAFPNTQLFLNVGLFEKALVNWTTRGPDLGPNGEIVEYAVSKGVGLRYDGLAPTELYTNKIVHDTFVDKCLSTKTGSRVKCNYEFAYSVPDPVKFASTVDYGLSAPVSYMFVNPSLRPAVRPSTANLKTITTAATKIGYRFVLDSMRITFPESFPKGSALSMSTQQMWRNEGVAPCHSDYDIGYAIIDKNNSVVREGQFSPVPVTSDWLPSETKTIIAGIMLGVITDGTYALHISVYDSKKPDRKIGLGIKGLQGDGTYKIAKVIVETKANGSRTITVTDP